MKNKRYETIDSLSLTRDTKDWFKEGGVRFVQELGIHQGQIVLDFGCRIGNYSIPAAFSVKPNGKIFALDSDHDAIDALIKMSSKLGLEDIIVPLKTRGELIIDLAETSVDHVLLFDVLHILLRNTNSLETIITFFREIKRVLKNGGTFSLLIEHFSETGYDLEDILTVLKKIFNYKGKISTKLLHWDHLRQGDVYLFRK